MASSSIRPDQLANLILLDVFTVSKSNLAVIHEELKELAVPARGQEPHEDQDREQQHQQEGTRGLNGERF